MSAVVLNGGGGATLRGSALYAVTWRALGLGAGDGRLGLAGAHEAALRVRHRELLPIALEDAP